VFSQIRAARAHPGVVEHQVGHAKALQRGRAQRFHGVGLGHIHAHTQHLRARLRQLGHRCVQRVLLHVNQHQVHAQAGTDAGAFEPETGPCAGQYSGGVAKVAHGAVHGVVHGSAPGGFEV